MSSEQENNDLSSEEINIGTDATPRKRARKKAAKKITNVDHHVESDEVTISSDIKVDNLVESDKAGSELPEGSQDSNGAPQKNRDDQGHHNDRKKGEVSLVRITGIINVGVVKIAGRIK